MPNWSDVLQQIGGLQSQGQRALDLIRRDYLARLHKETGRNIIAYYSGFLSKPGLAQLDINDEDKNGFMMAVHKLDKKLGLDLILHTPGGSIAATESVVNYLHKMFKSDIRAIVPQIAMSAGTMIACSCRSILMGEHSNLGPIDPQLRGIPAYGVLAEFKKAYAEIKKDATKAHLWGPILRQYHPTFLGHCKHAIDWSNQFVESWLAQVMLKGDPHAKAKAVKIRKRLSDYRENKAHDRHFHIEECEAIGLEIERLEEKGKETLQDLVLTVHHCYMHSLMNSSAFKIIENHNGVAFVKQVAAVQAGKPA